MQEIKLERAKTSKEKPDPSKLPFGTCFTDHMFLMNYEEGQGWHNPRIVPYAPLSLEPSAMVFHYSQSVFEGMKAYRTPAGQVQLFRPLDNIRRMNNSCDRLCIPRLDVDFALQAIRALVGLERDWVPSQPATSLYIRPLIIATEPHVGVHASRSYLFIIICCPVGSYYPTGINPVKIFVESEDVRAVKGGTGYTKTGGNYAATLRAGERAIQQGYSQVLWLDGVHRKYVDEVGSMNVLFKINGEIVTPPLEGSILPGVTRQSCLDLLRAWDIPVKECLISVDELFDAGETGALEEAFGSGTAAVVSPIGEMRWNDRNVVINNGEIGPLTQRLYDAITGIQWGTAPDPFGWTVPV